jgi:predicted O-linked N-acetylglucosamine transferase (SPINDLY family)
MDPVSQLRQLEEQLARHGENAELLLRLARIWRKLNAPAKALDNIKRSLALDDDSGPAWNTLGALLMDAKQWAEAENAFAKALSLDPQLPHAENNLALALSQQAWQVHEAAKQANWEPYEQKAKRLLKLHRKRMAHAGKALIAPFSVLGFHLSHAEQCAAARAQAEAFVEQAECQPVARASTAPGERRRIGFLSADFRNNAAGHLLHRLFAEHDRGRFEVFALSYGPEDGSDFRREIRKGVEHFVELRGQDDREAAQHIASLGLDIVVDLMGFAGNHRAGILARQPAPVQISWLGYCMSTGAPWIDVFVADHTTVTGAMASKFSERVEYLPNSYQIYSGQDFPRGSARRIDWGLPESDFVYACFNMPEKIDPAIWQRWMEILQAVPGSVLWLLCGDKVMLDNYRKRAKAQGVAPQRIVPAPLADKTQHLARLELADLFLDTPLCNAHTTASDALWAGVPVLTTPGELFAQRVAASVCQAAGLPDLICDTLDEYVEQAIRLGHDQPRVAELKHKLAQARRTAPLFDVARFAQDLEAVFDSAIDQAKL